MGELGSVAATDVARAHQHLAYVPADVELWPQLIGAEILHLQARTARSGLADSSSPAWPLGRTALVTASYTQVMADPAVAGSLQALACNPGHPVMRRTSWPATMPLWFADGRRDRRAEIRA